MVSIKPIINAPKNALVGLIGLGSKSYVVRRTGEAVQQNNRRFIDGLGVFSIILKDGLGCYFYVTQSLRNKDIPDDKRMFVASLDLTNGLLMILMQLALFFTVSNPKFQNMLFQKLFGHKFSRSSRKACRSVMQSIKGKSELDPIKFAKDYEKVKGNIKDALGGITSLAAATIVGKRMIVPFIATPLADKVKKRLDEGDTFKKSGISSKTEKKDKSNPSMQGEKVIKDSASAPQTKKAEDSKDQSTNLIERFQNKS